MNQSLKVRRLVEAAMIAAIYTVLTYAAAALNLAYQGVQFRFSEALTILPVFTPSAIPGLAIGCFLSNLGSPMGIIDWISGTSATLLATVLTRLLRNLTVKGLPVLAPFPPVLTNAVIVGCVIAVTDPAGFSVPLFAAMALSVGLGELAVCYGLGLPLIAVLKKTGVSKRIFLESQESPKRLI